MPAHDIRKRFLSFFEKRGHAVIPSAPVVPEHDPSTLFTTAGMQPLVPYLLGQPHPKGTRLVNVQKCVRTGDIDEVGDNTHLTFFEMLGNWSLGDYFKKEAIAWSYELLTSSEEGFGLDPKRLYVTVFEGDENAPRDDESAEIWKSLGVPEHRVYYRSAKDNWWSPGDNGPCGPDSEMFYDITPEGLGDLSPEAFQKADDEKKVVEIWNDVFMEYEKKDGKVIGKLAKQNVDTGAGLERLATVLQGKNNVFETDIFQPIFAVLPQGDGRAQRIVADHIRASVFMIADGVLPENTGAGYVLRRLIRRAVRFMEQETSLETIITRVIDTYKENYPELEKNKNQILAAITKEETRFKETLNKGLQEFKKGTDPFILATTYGFPIELTLELAREEGKTIDVETFGKKMAAHQETSRTASAGMFKGGLADTSDATIKLHTAHHLLLRALQEVLGPEVKQKGSNITPERLRMDFSFDRKMTDEEKQKVEDLVNEKIKEDLMVIRREMPREEAEKLGAEMEFGAKYPDVVSVYFIGPSPDARDDAFSIEFCGGPHTERTGALGHFKIQKEEASSAGVRRIKAILESDSSTE